MFFFLSNREIKCPVLVLTSRFDLCSMWHSWKALERGPVAIKKLTALPPLSEEIYCNNQFVTRSWPGQLHMDIRNGNKDNRPSL